MVVWVIVAVVAYWRDALQSGLGSTRGGVEEKVVVVMGGANNHPSPPYPGTRGLKVYPSSSTHLGQQDGGGARKPPIGEE